MKRKDSFEKPENSKKPKTNTSSSEIINLELTNEIEEFEKILFSDISTEQARSLFPEPIIFLPDNSRFLEHSVFKKKIEEQQSIIENQKIEIEQQNAIIKNKEKEIEILKNKVSDLEFHNSINISYCTNTQNLNYGLFTIKNAQEKKIRNLEKTKEKLKEKIKKLEKKQIDRLESSQDSSLKPPQSSH